MARMPAQRRLVVGVDLDEVCYPFIDAFRQWLVRHRGVDVRQLPMPTGWGVPARDWGFHHEDALLEEFCAAVRAGWLFRAGDPLPGAKDALVSLRRDGHRIVFATARSYVAVQDEIEAATRDWLDRHGLGHHQLVFAQDKTIVDADIFLDDAVHNYEAIEAAGGRPYLFTQPYNIDHPGRRVDDWPAFLTVVRTLARDGY